MYYNEEHYEIEYFDEEDYEEARRKDSAQLHRKMIRSLESRYGCTFPQFIMQAQSDEERSDLFHWSMAIRYLASHEEKMYS